MTCGSLLSRESTDMNEPEPESEPIPIPFPGGIRHSHPSPHPGIGGRFKVFPEDFVVEEIPVYEPCGTGEHLFLWIQKRDLSAESLVETVARILHIPRDAIGVAGLKDRYAVTRQWISIPATASDFVPELNSEALQVLRAVRHENKLKTGHLRGNRFDILIRDVDPQAASGVEELLCRIRRAGVPNFFGEQRFGVDGETLAQGASLLKKESHPREIPFRRRKFLVRLALSAVQSSLFNEVVRLREARGILRQVQPGDVMQVCQSGGLFVAEDVPCEQIRYEARETAITGPLFGPKMKSPRHSVFTLEQQVLEEAGLSREIFREHKKQTPGARRPLLMFPEEMQSQPDPHGIRISFVLPSGSYATVLLREIMGETNLSSAGESFPEKS